MVSHPQSYKAYAFLEKGGPLTRIDVPWNDPDAGQVVVKVLACGICASEEMVKYQILPGVSFPRIPGHEIIGEVAAVSPSEQTWKVGQRVGAGWHGGHCHTCELCRAGNFNMCSNQIVNGIAVDGGYAEYATLRTEALISIPEDMDPAAAAPLLCAGITVFNALRSVQAPPPEIVAVQGIGGLGHLAIQYAKAMGFQPVALSSSSGKEALAAALGAHVYLDCSKVNPADELQKLGGAKAILCTAPSPEAVPSLLGGLAVDGELLIATLSMSTVTLPVVAFVAKRLSMRGVNTGTPKVGEDCVRFSQANGIKTIVEKFPLDRAQEAYDHRDSARFRAVLIP